LSVTAAAAPTAPVITFLAATGVHRIVFRSAQDALAETWRLLLFRAASGAAVSDALLLRWIKDAADFDVGGMCARVNLLCLHHAFVPERNI
jgi:hypothetical protein